MYAHAYDRCGRDGVGSRTQSWPDVSPDQTAENIRIQGLSTGSYDRNETGQG